MSQPTALSVEEYLRTSYKPDREYVRGRLVERNVGEYTHSRMQVLVGAKLASHADDPSRFRTFFALRVRVGIGCYRVPDVCVKAWPHEVTPVLERPDLAVEILSAEDGASETLFKIADYHAGGVPYIWWIDPYKHIVIEVVHGEIRRPAAQVLATPLVGEVDFATLFAELDEDAE